VTTSKFLGTWFVIGVLPTPFETECCNAVEKYSFLNDNDETRINIDFTYTNESDKKRKVSAVDRKRWEAACCAVEPTTQLAALAMHNVVSKLSLSNSRSEATPLPPPFPSLPNNF